MRELDAFAVFKGLKDEFPLRNDRRKQQIFNSEKANATNLKNPETTCMIHNPSRHHADKIIGFTWIYWLFQKVTIAFIHKTKESRHWLELKHSLMSEYNTDEQHVLNP